MSELPARHDSESRLPPKTERYLSSLQAQARDLNLNLAASWRNPASHDKAIERRAMWHALRLAKACDEPWDRDRPVEDYRWLVYWAAGDADPEARYDLQAAMRMIPRLVPFTPPVITRLIDKHPAEDFETWEAYVQGQELPLADRWHRWLWDIDTEGLPAERDHGRASELAVATSRLADGLEVILGRE
jgi:hypothetical protein